MADYNLGTIADDVIQDAKGDSTLRTQVKRWIVRTQDKVLGHQRFNFNEDTTGETLSAGMSEYEPQCDFQQIIQLTFSHSTLTDVSRPVYIDADQFFEDFPLGSTTPEAGVPAYYTYYGRTIYFSRPLGGNYEMFLRFQKAPCRLTDEDETPDIPEEYSAILYEGGMAGVEHYRENHDIAAIHEREIENLSEDLLGRYGLRKRQPGKTRPLARRRVRRGA